jgi:hypothetical protein
MNGCHIMAAVFLFMDKSQPRMARASRRQSGRSGVRLPLPPPVMNGCHIMAAVFFVHGLKPAQEGYSLLTSPIKYCIAEF